MLRPHHACASLALTAACSVTPVVPDPGLEGLEITAVHPGTVIPGTTLVIEGRSFVGDPWGLSVLRFDGTYRDSFGEREVSVNVGARFVNYNRMEVEVDAALLDRFGPGDGQFRGDIRLEVASTVDGQTYTSYGLPATVELRRYLTPSLSGVATGELIFVNDPIAVEAGGLLLGGGEGTTVAVLEGCFSYAPGDSCEPVGPVEVPLRPDGPFDRERGRFAFEPQIVGIEAGSFTGSVFLQNQHAGGELRDSSTRPVAYDLTEPAVLGVQPSAASLGQYVDIIGGGFLGGEGGGVTLVEMTGSFHRSGAAEPLPVSNLFLVPEFVEGRRVRYVVNEDDALAGFVDLRRETGTFTGQLTPITSYGGVEVTGSSLTFELDVAPVKQVVELIFRSSYVESLRHFGLRAVDQRIRDRIALVIERDYHTINLEVRREKPTDFALYSEVEIWGPDPNGLGLLGYDNTPGKDTGNMRLHDKLGGVNAQTQEDGYPGYGGVFIESLFAFSEHPAPFANRVSAATPTFDRIFDPFRPDRGGTPVTAADLTGGLPALESSEECPASERRKQIACAVWVLGSLVGTTLSHEIGHSLGLANPYGQGFHNPGGVPNRLMNPGADRSFLERAELEGHGPALFCDEEYDYLRDILPTSLPEDTRPRPPCF